MNRTDDIIFIRSFIVYIAWFAIVAVTIASTSIYQDRLRASGIISILTLSFVAFLLVVYLIFVFTRKLFYEKSFQFVVIVSAILNIVVVLSLLSLSTDEKSVVVIFAIFYGVFIEVPRFGFYTDDLEPGLIAKFTDFFLTNYSRFITGFFIFSMAIILISIPTITIAQSILLLASNGLVLFLGWVIALKMKLNDQMPKLKWAMKLEGIACSIVLSYGIVHDITHWFT